MGLVLKRYSASVIVQIVPVVWTIEYLYNFRYITEGKVLKILKVLNGVSYL